MECTENWLQLLNNITGEFSRILYALKGDFVRIVSDHGKVVIVENKKGARFTVNKADLSAEVVEEVITKIPIEPKQNKKTVRNNTASKSSALLTNQNQLF